MFDGQNMSNEMKPNELKKIISDFVDYLLPDLTPPEVSLYIVLLKNSIISTNKTEIRIGKRTLAEAYGRGSQGAKTNYNNITRILNKLSEKGCVTIGDTNREGTLYRLTLPKNIPLVSEKLATLEVTDQDEDYFSVPGKRKIIFDRDNWLCQYCGEKVTESTATIDHYIPQSKGGKHNKENLRTACLLCNSIKSGKSFEEAAPLILKSIQERKQRETR